MEPKFPRFKSIELRDRAIFQSFLAEYKPNTSEWTFSNLFIWRSHYGFRWSLFEDWLLVLCGGGEDGAYGLQPIGPTPRDRAVATLLSFLKDSEGREHAFVERADARTVAELRDSSAFRIEPARDHFDYVYLRNNLARLEGNRFRSKRNHINKLQRTHTFSYEALEERHIDACLDLQERWCRIRRCRDDLNLLGEWEAVREVLTHFATLELMGGVIVLEGRVDAFTVGEMLNDNTAVVHIEKADPKIPGLYPIINQQFCENALVRASYVNREQDLGVPGLREAKMSYYPDHFEEKYRITLA